MKVEIWVVGKTQSPAISSEEKKYIKRLRRFIPIQYTVIPEIRSGKALSPPEQTQREGQQILQRLPIGDYLILMDPVGKQYTSPQFSSYMNALLQRSEKRATFLIGGPYGFSNEIQERANHKLSLSRMTFPHDLARLILLEQLYRAMTILNHMPYHHG